jgi:hypothetical protein
VSRSALTATAPEKTAAASRKLSLAPTLLDLFFLTLIAWLFVIPPEGWSRLLEDGDIGWHIRVGEWILDHRSIPREDFFSFTRPGGPWFAWEWGAELIYGVLFRVWGLKGIVLFSGAQIALFGAILVRYSLWRGANPLLAVGLSLAGVGATSIHFLARPHLYTLILVPVALWMLEADRRFPGWRIWLLAPVTAIWVNLHGGFLAVPALAGLMAVGGGLEEWWRGRGRAAAFRVAVRYCGLAAACALASVINPYGIALHAHAFSHLSAGWIREIVDEFQPPDFRRENVQQFGVLLALGLLSVPMMLRRRRVTEALWMLFWAQQSLGSVRHITLFVAVAVPVVGTELSRIWAKWVESGGPRSLRAALDGFAGDLNAGCSRITAWPAILLAGVLVLDAPLGWPADFPSAKFPTGEIGRHAGLLAASRVYTSDEWADYLIFRNWPRQRVFIDGRIDFYGREIGRSALDLSQARPGWEQTLERFSVDVVVAAPGWPLARALAVDGRWAVVEKSDKAVIFQRIAGGPSTAPEAAGKFVGAGTNGFTQTSRILLGRAPK